MQAWHTLRMTCDPAGVPALEELLATQALPFSVWEPPPGVAGPALVTCFCATADEAPAAHARLAAGLREWAPLLPAPVTLATEIVVLPPEDWAETWKRFFHPRRVSPRLVVRPSWETYAAAPGDLVLVIDPGTAFGTGQHATTVACLQFLDELAGTAAPLADQRPRGPGAPPGAPRFLDVGCGSGILSLAAAKLGLGPALGLDLDPLAVTASDENLARNAPPAGACRFVVADLAAFVPPAPAPLVAANILAEVLIAHAARLAGWVATAPGSALLVAGILTTQYPAVLAAFAPHGLREHRRTSLDEWTSGWLRRA